MIVQVLDDNGTVIAEVHPSKGMQGELAVLEEAAGILRAAAGDSSPAAFSPLDAPLGVEIVGGKLLVAIGINTLAWAAQPENDGPLKGWRISSGRELEWAEDVAREMMRETVGWNEQPSVGVWIDKMMVAASECGSGAQERTPEV